MAVRFGIGVLRRIYGQRPWPVTAVRLLDRVGKWIALTPPLQECISSGASIRNPFLSEFFRDVEVGNTSLTVPTLDFLEAQIKSFAPQLIFEFGSGISTVCLARFMQELHGPSGERRVLSVDQDDGYAEITRGLLKKAGLDNMAGVFVAPLGAQEINGHTIRCYEMKDIGTFFGGRKADFVLIDGPFDRETPSRYGTLPQIRPFLKSGTPFFLDDAFRAKELLIAALWKKLPYIRLRGIHPVGKGLLEGRVL
ncbi:MAG TPA: class I SAM-dependent methyltransferase [Verrucomicrobiae bacterium]|nr:class I SAM-dependent methyltransferase [Verrucomicrobiae bacterium]